MRLLYLTDRLSQRGGAGQHLLQVIGDAVAAEHEVTVACGRRDRDAMVPDSVKVVVVRGLAPAVTSTARLSRLPGLLEQADVVHVQNVMNPEALREAVATGRMVVTVQDHRVLCPAMGKTLPDGNACLEPMSEEVCMRCLPDDAYRARLLALTRARRDALRGVRLVVLSRYMARALDAVGLDGAEVVPPWVEVADGTVIVGDGLVLGGRLVRHKAVLDAWQAWRQAGCGLPLRVAGEGPLAAELKGAEQLGWLGRDELRRLLHSARALLFPARWQEPFGILGVEALSTGTPVVVADVGGTREWSDKGCLRVPNGDVQAMAAAVARLAADQDLAVRLGEQGREMVVERFCRATVTERLQRLYSSVA